MREAPPLAIARPLATALLVLASLLGGCLRDGPSDAPQAGSGAGTPPVVDQSMVSAAQADEARTFRIVPRQSKASYHAQEKWASWSVPTRAVAHTTDVEGEFVLTMGDQPKLDANRFRVDMRTLVSEVGETPLGLPQFVGSPAALVLSARDRIVRNSLEADRYPFAEFTATDLEGLPARYVEGHEVKVQVRGNLTVRDVARTVTFDTEATLHGAALSGTATTHLRMTDFGVTPPRGGGVARVEDEVTIVVQFVAAAVPTPTASLVSTDRHPKLDSPLIALARIARERGAAEALEAAGQEGVLVTDGRVRIILDAPRGVEPRAVRAAIAAVGAQIEDGRPGVTGSVFLVLAPIVAIEELADRPEVRYLRTPLREEPGGLQRE
jgi:hypothetical protein